MSSFEATAQFNRVAPGDEFRHAVCADRYAELTVRLVRVGAALGGGIGDVGKRSRRPRVGVPAVALEIPAYVCEGCTRS